MPINIDLTFCSENSGSEATFRWTPLPTRLAEKWFNLLIFSLEKPSTIREQKFFGWNAKEERRHQICAQLNASIATINSELNGKYTIPPLAKIFQPNQEELNALHVHFEKLMGKTWEKSPYLNGISDLGITAIRNLNEQIHFYEDWQRTKNTLELEGNYYGGFQFQLYPFTHQELTNEDLKTFSTEQAMGDLVTPYCQLGKHWLEVFTDQDMEVGLENISPLRYFGPNGYCRFFAKSAQEAEVERKKVVEFIQEYAEKRNIPFLGDSPSLAIGHSRLASLAPESELRRWSSTQRAEFFETHDSISRMEIRIGAQVWEKKFGKKNTMFVESDFSEEAFIRPTESQINASRFDPHLPR